MIGRLKWYYSRLRTMNPGELIFRAGQARQRVMEKWLPSTPVYRGATSNIIPLSFDFSNARINPGFSIFGQDIDIFQPIDFHRDIFSGKRFPLSFAKTIDMRTDRYGSAKVVWEVNRLQFLIPLLIRYRQTSDKQLLARFISILKEWDEQNPYMKGLNWYSNIEVSMRLINWYWCWLLLQDDEHWNNDEAARNFRENTWLPLIHRHCSYSAINPSLYSSANNHLVAEYTGLFMAASLWNFRESDQWIRKSQAGLEKQILLQHSVNGVNKEEAAAYIQFITDFFLIAWIAGEQLDHSFSTAYKDRLTSILGYIHNILDVKGNIPRYGDDDDGRVIMPDGYFSTNNFLSILNTASVLFDRPEWKQPQAGLDPKSILLTAHQDGLKKWNGISSLPRPFNSAFYPAEGHFIFRNLTSGGKEVFCHFDAAALGYLSIAAHGHADALSIILHADGYPFLVDPGTYAYHTHMEWRKYFVSTVAHNTITIDNEDQATMAGPTLWLNHFTCSVTEVKEGETEIVSATHNGYKQKGVSHSRTMQFNRKNNCFVVTDIVAARKNGHRVTMPFHLHPHVEATQTGSHTYKLSHPETSVTAELLFDPQLTLAHREADETSPLGWYSGSFMKKEEAAVLIGEHLMKQNQLTLTTIIKIEDLS